MFQTMPAWKPDVSIAKVDGQGNPASLKLGEWMKYHMCIDLPVITDDKNIEFEMWTNDSNNGKYFDCKLKHHHHNYFQVLQVTQSQVAPLFH